MDWLDLLAVQGTLKSLLQYHSSKASILQRSAFFTVQLSHPHMTTGKTIALTRRTFVSKVILIYFLTSEFGTCCGDSAARRRADENVFFPVVTLLNRRVFYSSFLPLCCARLSFMASWHACALLLSIRMSAPTLWPLLPHPQSCDAPERVLP